MKEMVQAFEVLLPKLHSVYDAAAEAKGSFIEEEAVNEALVELSKIGYQIILDLVPRIPSHPWLPLHPLSNLLPCRPSLKRWKISVTQSRNPFTSKMMLKLSMPEYPRSLIFKG